MNYHFFSADLAYDADWKEGDHPRADNGQFGNGSSSPSSTPSNGIKSQAQVSSTLTGVFTQAGFKKQKQPGVNGTTVYFHPASGAKVSVHPAPEGKKWSSKWTHEVNGEAKSGEGSSLAKLLGVVVKKAEAKQAEAAVPTPAIVENTKGFASFLKDKGYKPEKQQGAEVVLAAPNGAKVKFDANTSEWIAQTPGHMTKEGKGVEALQQLMQGKIVPGVTNTNKTATIVDPAAKKAAEEQAKVQAAESAKKAIAMAKATATFETYKKAAPVATGIQSQAIISYCNNGYASMNNSLRQGGGDKVSPSVKAIDSYLLSSSFPEDGVVYRGIKGDFAMHLKSVLMKGSKFADYGFISTSAFEHSAFGGHMRMKINIKKGQKGAAVAQISHHPGENEILLPRESMFEVVSYNRQTGEVEVNLIQDHFE